MKLHHALLAAFIPLTYTQTAHAQWVSNGIGVCTMPQSQNDAAVLPDGSGGAFVVWSDFRNGNYDLFVQRINASGVTLWTKDGVLLSDAPNGQLSATIIADGAGGAIISWFDYRPGLTTDIYAQRINAFGVPQWTANGVALCTATGDQTYPTLVSDGAGGAIVTWMDTRGGLKDIYIRRINSAGTPQWTANGVAVCTASNNQESPTIVSDGSGGAIVTWWDLRSGTNYDIYARRINSSGTPLWTVNGNSLCTAADDQTGPVIVADNAGGAVVAWTDQRSGTNNDVYAQRINGSGTVLWTANGVAVSIATNHQQGPQIAPDGSGGAIITWHDSRSTNYDIYVQKISAAGAEQWTEDGVALCAATNDQVNSVIAADGAGGAIVAWSDARPGVTTDIYAQRIDASGLTQWTGNGAAVCTAPNNQHDIALTSNGADGAILAWLDIRGGVDIYAQRLEGTFGYWGYPEPIVTSVADIPNDQGGHVAVNWKASGRDDTVPRTVDRYTIWRAVDPLAMTPPLGSAPSLTNLLDVRADAVPPVYISTPSTSPPPYYWELVGTQLAHGWPGYSFSAPTRGDNTPQFFMVAAHVQFDDYIAFTSNAMSGQSVDNLAPSSPLMLTAQRIGSYVYLNWTGVHVPDLRDYSVYRKTSSGGTPVPIHLLASSEDTIMADTTPPASALYYIVTAVDVHQNQSAPSNEASVGAATNVGNLPPVTALTVLQNHPNPFTEATELRVGLPAKADIEVELFDVAGRRVRSELLPQRTKGWNTVRLDARDDRGAALPSGVYFYRVHAGGETVASKMVIAR